MQSRITVHKLLPGGGGAAAFTTAAGCPNKPPPNDTVVSGGCCPNPLNDGTPLPPSAFSVGAALKSDDAVVPVAVVVTVLVVPKVQEAVGSGTKKEGAAPPPPTSGEVTRLDESWAAEGKPLALLSPPMLVPPTFTSLIPPVFKSLVPSAFELSASAVPNPTKLPKPLAEVVASTVKRVESMRGGCHDGTVYRVCVESEASSKSDTDIENVSTRWSK